MSTPSTHLYCPCPSCKATVRVPRPAAGLEALTKEMVLGACRKCTPAAGQAKTAPAAQTVPAASPQERQEAPRSHIPRDAYRV